MTSIGPRRTSRCMPVRCCIGVLCVLAAGLPAELQGAGWHQYRADGARSGYTKEELPAQLHRQWSYHASHPPQPAWPKDQRRLYDPVYHPVISAGQLYFGSSVDGKVYALDAASGRERWVFHTTAPVRFAPVIWRDRLLVGSDDGYLYCLSARDGALLWKKRPGPSDRLILGNGRLVSPWAIRGGPALVDDVLYVAAGVWPADGVYLCAFNPETGEPHWINSDLGGIKRGHPHDPNPIAAGFGVQGYLVVSDGTVYVPTGRSGFAQFQLKDGKLKTSFAARDEGVHGAAYGPAFAPFQSCAGSNEQVFYYKSKKFYIWDLNPPFLFSEVQKRGKTVKVPRRNIKASFRAQAPTALIQAGKTLYCGSAGQVQAVDSVSRKAIWTGKTDGTVHGLAIAEGRLYASTDKGTIHCFGARPQTKPNITKPEMSSKTRQVDSAHAKAAEEILKLSETTEGFCLDLGCGTGELALALARRSQFRVYAIESDPGKVAAARKSLEQAGLYGDRVMVHLGDPARTPYPDYFADLIVSGRSIVDGGGAVSGTEAARLQRPYGGVLCIGRPGAIQKKTRGPLDGAGAWTHQFADPSNTCNSGDTLVKGPLRTHWYGDFTLQMAERHGRPPAPLFFNGRLYVLGFHALRAISAYNGHSLWEYPLPRIGLTYDRGNNQRGSAFSGPTYCVGRGGVYVVHSGRCLRIDSATGKKLGEFSAPKQANGTPGKWGVVVHTEDLLIGSVADSAHLVPGYDRKPVKDLFTESRSLFAADAASGAINWTRNADHSIRHNAIAVGKTSVFYIDREVAKVSRVEKKVVVRHPPGKLFALNAKTGKELWRNTDEIHGTVLALSKEHDVLVMCGQNITWNLRTEGGGRVSAFRASTGKKLWSVRAGYSARPMITGRTILFQNMKQDLLTGKRTKYRVRRNYGCGIMSGGAHILLFRSAVLGYANPTESAPITGHYGGVRPGCWINAIPAGGLVLMPEGSTGCRCAYSNKAIVVLRGK